MTFYTADLHLGHRRVAGLRGYEMTEDHDQAIIDSWRRQVHPDELVWVLGDIAMSRHQDALDLLTGLPGRKRLIAGNHDPVHPMHRTRVAHWHRQFGEVFEVVQPYSRIRLDRHEVLLSHLPYMDVGDGAGRGPARYEQYRLPNLGVPLIHGHTHSNELIEGPRQLHVGWDAWGGLVPEARVIEWLDHLDGGDET